MFKKMHVVLWSPKQKEFHIDRVEDMLRDNLRAYKENYPVDYIPLVFTDSYEQAIEAREILRGKKRK